LIYQNYQTNNRIWFIIGFIVWLLFAYWAMKLPTHCYDDTNEQYPDEYELQGGGSWGH
jgi:hypothetical protein